MAKRTRPMIGVQRRYAWRLYPTPEQAARLLEVARMRVRFWNALLDICERRYAAAVQRETVWWFDKHGEPHARFGRVVGFHCQRCSDLSPFREDGTRKVVLCQDHELPRKQASVWIKELRAECEEWRDLAAWTAHRIREQLFLAWDAFFRRLAAGERKRAGYPRFKSVKSDADTIPFRCLGPNGASGCKVDKSGRHTNSYEIYLAGISDEALWRRGHGRGDVWARNALPVSHDKVNGWGYADVRFVDGKWDISVVVEIDKRRKSAPGRLSPTTVKFDLIDGFAVVNGAPDTPKDLCGDDGAQNLDNRRAAMQAAFDLRWPHGKRWSDDEWRERCEEKAEIGKLSSRIARIRKNALHVWSKRIVECASALTIYKPNIKDNTKSPRGNNQEWGAAVSTVSSLNRRALSYAPAMAVQMLEYKAHEIGIPVQVIEDTRPEIAVGEKLVAAGKTVRKLKRAIERNDNERNQQRVGRTGRSDRGGDGFGQRSHEPQGRPQAGQAGV